MFVHYSENWLGIHGSNPFCFLLFSRRKSPWRRFRVFVVVGVCCWTVKLPICCLLAGLTPHIWTKKRGKTKEGLFWQGVIPQKTKEENLLFYRDRISVWDYLPTRVSWPQKQHVCAKNQHHCPGIFPILLSGIPQGWWWIFLANLPGIFSWNGKLMKNTWLLFKLYKPLHFQWKTPCIFIIIRLSCQTWNFYYCSPEQKNIK